METLRRLLLCLFTIAAITTWFAPAETLYRIAGVEFKNELEHHPFPWKHKGKSVSQYIEEVTRDRTYSVSPGQWRHIAAEAGSSRSGFVESDNQKIQQLIPYFSRQVSHLYIKQGQGNDYMRIARLSPRDYSYKQAPHDFQKPYYLWSPFLFLTGILFYIFLPRYQFSDDTLHYGAGFRAVIGPDMVGLFFIGFFFILGLGVGLSGSSSGISSLFSSNLIIATCILWAFTLFGFYILRIGARYASLALNCSAEKVCRFSPLGAEVILHSNIDSVMLGHWKASKWVTRLGFFISFLNWRAAGPTLLNAGRNDPFLEVHLKDGRVWRYDLIGAQNVNTVLLCLQKNGVKVDPKLREIISL